MVRCRCNRNYFFTSFSQHVNWCETCGSKHVISNVARDALLDEVQWLSRQDPYIFCPTCGEELDDFIFLRCHRKECMQLIFRVSRAVTRHELVQLARALTGAVS